MVSFSDSFMLTEDNLSSMNSMLHRYKDVELGKKRQIRDEAMEQVRAVQHLEDRQKQILDLEKKVVWADVQAIEDDIAGRESPRFRRSTRRWRRSRVPAIPRRRSWRRC